MPAANVRRRDILPLLEVVAAGHPRAAGNARQLIGTMFGWAEQQEIVATDPTRGLPAYDQGQARDRFLDADEIRLLWPWLETLPPAVADVLRLQLLLGARIGEVGGMLAVEVDRQKWLWTLPAARSKNKKPRVTPLIGLARQIVEARLDDAGDGPLFSSERGTALTSTSIGMALFNRRGLLPIATFKTHDLRRTVTSTMLELGISRDVIGAIVGHESDDGSRTLLRHYLWSTLIKRKTHALEAWHKRLHDIVSGAPEEDNVIQLVNG
jgi:integrase